jgi:hypothetical protein
LDTKLDAVIRELEGGLGSGSTIDINDVIGRIRALIRFKDETVLDEFPPVYGVSYGAVFRLLRAIDVHLDDAVQLVIKNQGAGGTSDRALLIKWLKRAKAKKKQLEQMLRAAKPLRRGRKPGGASNARALKALGKLDKAMDTLIADLPNEHFFITRGDTLVALGELTSLKLDVIIAFPAVFGDPFYVYYRLKNLDDYLLAAYRLASGTSRSGQRDLAGALKELKNAKLAKEQLLACLGVKPQQPTPPTPSGPCKSPPPTPGGTTGTSGTSGTGGATGTGTGTTGNGGGTTSGSSQSSFTVSVMGSYGWPMMPGPLPNDCVDVTTSPAQPGATGTVTKTGQNYNQSQPITLDANGKGRVIFSIPPQPATYNLSATITSGGATVQGTATEQVQPPPPFNTGNPPCPSPM